MAFTLSSLDVMFLVREFQTLIQDAFVDKIYQGKADKGDFLIRMRSPKFGKQQLYLQVPDAIFLTEHRFSWPKVPSGFCMQLRKHLTNTKLVSVRQVGFERIIELVFTKGDTTWKLILELFSKGNVVLVNNEGIIRGVMDLQRWKDRTLRVNAPYVLPPGKRDITSLSEKDFIGLFSDMDRPLVKFCATELGLGGKYSEELIARSGLDKNMTSISKEELGELFSSLKGLFTEKLYPISYDGDVAPFILKAWENEDVVEFDSYSKAIENEIVAEKTEVIEQDAEAQLNEHKDKYQKIIDQQSRMLENYEKSSVENTRKGELIYENYSALNSLLEQVKRLHKESGWDAVKEFLKDKPVKINEKEAKITLELKE